MALSELTSPEAVHAAVREYEELGRDEFLERYGFGRARDYMLVIDGHEYDSKAIVGVAHGIQHPELGALRSEDFSGGAPTIEKLRALGFEVVSLGEPTEQLGPALARFLAEYAAAKSQPFSGAHPVAQLLKRVAGQIERSLPPSLAGARVKPSVGQGNWAAVPWVAVLDPRVTDTTQHGVYPVLLVREDLSGLLVSIAQGVTDLKRAHGVRAAYAELRERARALHQHVSALTTAGFALQAEVDLGPSQLARDYTASVVASRYVAADALSESSIDTDIGTVLGVYGALVGAGLVGSPTADPGDDRSRVLCIYVGESARANFESGGRRGWWGWRQQPGREAASVRVGDLVAFASGYSGGSPRVDASQWQLGTVRELSIGRIERPPFQTDEKIMPDEVAGTAEYPWKFRFTLLGDEAGVALGGGGDLSAPVSEAFRRSAIARGQGNLAPVDGAPLIERYLRGPALRPSLPSDVAAMSSVFLEQVRASGMKVDPAQLIASLASVLAKPFAILTGQSGSGKTQLAMRLGEWAGQDARGRQRYAVVPVRPDWTGPEFLFGYRDALAPPSAHGAVWAVPDTLAFILRASSDPTAPYVLVLDEMNLAHVERYFADFLSGIESGEPIVPDLALHDEVWTERDGSGRVSLPTNLIVIGTVNVDETTYTFSPKVLDRAFVHEFRVTSDDLDPGLGRPQIIDAADESIRLQIVSLLQDREWHRRHPHPNQDTLVRELQRLHERLTTVRLEFGHRVLYEALRFASIAHAAGLDSTEQVLDFIVMTKLLPKVNGSRQRLAAALRELHKWAHGAEAGKPARLPRSAEKLDRMLRVLQEAQFVTFTE
jgi:hypothetical protein